GPLVIPHLYNGRNKTFWFFSEQSDRNRNAATGTATVPIDAWRNGDFSNLKNGNGQAVVIYDPDTGMPQTDPSGRSHLIQATVPPRHVSPRSRRGCSGTGRSRIRRRPTLTRIPTTSTPPVAPVRGPTSSTSALTTTSATNSKCGAAARSR